MARKIGQDARTGEFIPVGRVIASYGISFVAAVGLLWIALSAGYWFGVRDPISAAQKAPPQQAETSIDPAKERQKKRDVALSAVRRIIDKLEGVDRVVAGTYGEKENTRREWLEKCRPEVQADTQLLIHSGFVVPPVDEFDAWQAAALMKYTKEIEPSLARGLLEQAISLAADTVARVTAVLNEQKSRKR